MSILGSIAGGLIKASATKKAANITADSAAKALAAQTGAAEKVQGLNAAGLGVYNNSLNALSARAGVPGASVVDGAVAGASNALSPGSYGDLSNPTLAASNRPAALDLSAGAFQESPGFQFALDRGLGAVDSNFAHRGAFNSGAAGKALTSFATGLANQEYNNWADDATSRFNSANAQFNTDRNADAARYENDRGYLTDQYNRQTTDLGNLLDVGQNALSATSNAYGAIGKAGADAATATGNAYAGNALQKGNIWSGVLADSEGQITKALTGLVGKPG